MNSLLERYTELGHLINVELAEKNAEIERLREGERAAETEIKRLRDIIYRASKEWQSLNKEADDEIKRLRGLLLEVWNWSIGGPTGVSSDLFERVREALGD